MSSNKDMQGYSIALAYNGLLNTNSLLGAAYLNRSSW